MSEVTLYMTSLSVFLRPSLGGGAHMAAVLVVQGYLAHKKPLPPLEMQ